MLPLSYDVIFIPSENYDPQAPVDVKFLILHCIGLSFEAVIEGLTKVRPRGFGVSSHYFIPQQTGKDLLDHGLISSQIPLYYPDQVPVIQFVPEEVQAWHAGKSQWGGFQNLNEYSLGIEFHAPGYGGGSSEDLFHFTPYTSPQLETGEKLLTDLIHRHQISSQNLLAHSDIAPQRKADPGPFFPWRSLASKGIGYMPSLAPLSGKQGGHLGKQESFVREKLSQIGYDISLDGPVWGPQERFVVNAYRLHFMQDFPSFSIKSPQDPDFGIIQEDLLFSLHTHNL